MSNQLIDRILTVLATLVAAYFVYRASTRATAATREGNQLSWVKEARDEARIARQDAEKAEQAADAARSKARAAERHLDELEEQVVSLSGWVVRVVGWAQDPDIDHAALRRLINGGPPSWRRRPPEEDR